MITAERNLRDIATTALEAATADGVEVIVTENNSALTRFAGNEIHQNVAEDQVDARVRVIAGRRTGVASTNQVDLDSLREAARAALDTARNQPEREDLPALPAPSSVDPAPADEATANATPEERAEMVGQICKQAVAKGVRAFGALATGIVRIAVANSNGLYVETPRTVADLRIVTMSDGGTGYANRSSSRLADIDAAGAGQEAVDKALRTIGAEPIEPGTYPVVMEEYAIGTIMEYLSYIGFGARAVEEGRSFMRPGETITGGNITVWDDGLDPAGLPIPFDFEGVPRHRVNLITDGVATGLVHDVSSAARAGVQSTGHGLPSPNPFGAWATNLFMAGGDAASKDDLLQGVKRGVWVTRLHYVNIVQPRQSQLTGMTRDGTFLIENGKITRPIKDMRFTQSIMEAFAGAEAMTRTRKLEAGEDYDFTTAAVVPAMQLREFTFTSVTR